MKGAIVLVHFPFTDLSATKLRPALVIHENVSDAVVAFISSRVPDYLSDADLLITPDHPAFAGTGLKRESVIKFDKVATVSRDLKRRRDRGDRSTACPRMQCSDEPDIYGLNRL